MCIDTNVENENAYRYEFSEMEYTILHCKINIIVLCMIVLTNIFNVSIIVFNFIDYIDLKVEI